MKKLLFACTIATIITASEPPATPQDPTLQYLDKKACPAIIHDAYYEAECYDKELPPPWKDALEKFGFKENEVNFYTTVRTNCFVERVENNLIILRPNFFLYCTPAEQAAYIGLRLAELRRGDKNFVGGSHGTFYPPNSKLSSLPIKSIGAATLGLLGVYHKQLLEKSKQWLPTTKDILFSKETAQTAAVVAVCFAPNVIQKILQKRSGNKKFIAIEKEVVDRLGAEGLLSIREKQTHWGYNNHSWLTNKWYQLLGKLDLAYNPETSLQRITEYVEQKQKAD